MNKKVLVTGSSGQLGLTIRELSFKLYDEVDFVFANKSQIDISDNLLLESLFREIKFDFCINCAAYTNVEQAEINPEEAFRINADAVKCLAQICDKYSTTLIHISTDYVFDGTSKKSYIEDSPTNPINKYGESKLKGEEYIQEILSDYYIIRTSWLYSTHGDNFLKTVINKIKLNEKLSITVDQVGTPSSCLDLTEFIFYLINLKQNKLYGILHFTALGETTWFHFAKQIAHYYSNYDKTRIQPIENYKTRAKRPKYSVLSMKKTNLFYSNIKSWKDSLKQVLIKLEN